jgi:tetratricopeptide (TPR) repeat protein
LARAIKIEPDNVEAKGYAALLYLAKGDYERAAFYAEQIIAIDPSDPYAYAILAPARWRQGRAIEAIALEEKAIRLSPRDPFVDAWYRDLGMTYLLLGRDAEAVLWLEKAVRANDKVYFYHEYLASAYALTGRLDEAHKEVAATLRLFPGYTVAKSVALNRRLGSTEAYLKQFDHVVDGLRKAGLPEN